jgi:hypothetical protein
MDTPVPVGQISATACVHDLVYLQTIEFYKMHSVFGNMLECLFAYSDFSDWLK